MKRIICNGICSNNKVIRSCQGWIKEKNLEHNTAFCWTCGNRCGDIGTKEKRKKAWKKNSVYYIQGVPKYARERNCVREMIMLDDLFCG